MGHFLLDFVFASLLIAIGFAYLVHRPARLLPLVIELLRKCAVV